MGEVSAGGSGIALVGLSNYLQDIGQLSIFVNRRTVHIGGNMIYRFGRSLFHTQSIANIIVNIYIN